jgi:ribosomal protein L39E
MLKCLERKARVYGAMRTNREIPQGLGSGG